MSAGYASDRKGWQPVGASQGTCGPPGRSLHASHVWGLPPYREGGGRRRSFRGDEGSHFFIKQVGEKQLMKKPQCTIGLTLRMSRAGGREIVRNELM